MIGDMIGRLSKVEADVEHIKTDITEIKGDLRHLLYGLIGGFLILAGAMWGGYVALDSNDDEIKTILMDVER